MNNIPAEFWSELLKAFLLFLLINIAGTGTVVKAYYDRQARKIKAAALKAENDVKDAAAVAAEALKDREEARRKDREADEQKRLTLEAQLAQNEGQNILMMNIATAVMKQSESMAGEHFRNRETMSILSQSHDDLIDSVDGMAGELGDNNRQTRAVVLALNALTNSLPGQFDKTNALIVAKAAEIIRLLERPADEPPAALPLASGE